MIESVLSKLKSRKRSGLQMVEQPTFSREVFESPSMFHKAVSTVIGSNRKKMHFFCDEKKFIDSAKAFL